MINACRQRLRNHVGLLLDGAGTGPPPDGHHRESGSFTVDWIVLHHTTIGPATIRASDPGAVSAMPASARC